MPRARLLRIYLLRHGQVAANRDMRYVGRVDQELTADGRAQARALADAFRSVRLDRVVSSPRLRARQTAEEILGLHPLGPAALSEHSGLAEQDFGEWEGRSRDEIVAEGDGPREQLAAFDRSPDVAAPGGESFSDVARRVGRVVEQAEREGVERLMLVSHVGPTKALLAELLGLTLLDVRRFFLDPGSFTVLDRQPEPGRGLLRMFNAPGHVEWLAHRWMRDHRLDS
ncbi:MAG: histidine phosphatase family protein [Acidobacteria bacterium]|nr:MAG: histidine phosphatase family protein [Acidobacteriota bacterium]REK10124.1 MAG: histidine phosphatase family protein [Acidobacteriota bacterium]